MRCFTIAFALLTFAGCATQRAATPREYLDEETAATVTVVADPWIFSAKRTQRAMPTLMDDRSAAAVDSSGQQSEFATEPRDLISLYAIDVNRMGDHRQYLAVLQSLPRVSNGSDASTTALELRVAGQALILLPVRQAPRELGIARPPVDVHARASQWSYFAVSKEVLANIARSSDLQPTLVVDADRVAYDSWRDGSAEMTALTAVLP